MTDNMEKGHAVLVGFICAIKQDGCRKLFDQFEPMGVSKKE
jgi:hypothetical protein